MLQKRGFDRGRLVLPATIFGGSLVIVGGALAIRELWVWSLTMLGQLVVHFCQLTIWAAQ